jgi:hypothetical protein
MQSSRHEGSRCDRVGAKTCEVIGVLVGLKGPDARLTDTSVAIVHQNRGTVSGSHIFAMLASSPLVPRLDECIVPSFLEILQGHRQHFLGVLLSQLSNKGNYMVAHTHTRRIKGADFMLCCQLEVCLGGCCKTMVQ